MSVSVNVYILAGAEYTEVVEEEETFSQVIKYDPDDGSPYGTTQKKTVWKVGEQVFQYSYEAHDAIENIGLVIYDDGDESVLIGETVDGLCDYEIASGLGECLSVNYIEQKVKSVSDKLVALGVKDVDVNVRLFSQVSC